MSSFRIGVLLAVVVSGLAASGCSTTPSSSAALEAEYAVGESGDYPEVRPAALTPVTSASVSTQEASPAPTLGPPEWQFTASLYLWAPSKRGVIEANNLGIPLDDPDESTGGFFYFEGERGQWGFIADLDTLSSEDRADGPGGEIVVDEDTFVGELDVTYRVNETLQFLAGLRVLDSAQDIDFPVLMDVSTDVTQVDPLLGAQGTWSLGESSSFRLRGDIGGFGIDSDLTYQALGVFGWEFAKRWTLTAGYRTLGWEFESDGVRNDLRLSGPLLGIAASF